MADYSNYITPLKKSGRLGKGDFGYVYIVKDVNNSQLYVMRIPLEEEYGCQPNSMESETTLYTKEIEVQNEVQQKSKYILNFISEFHFNDRRGFIFEYCTFGSLKNVLENLRSQNMYMHPYLICRIFKQVAEAISFLHKKDRNSHRVTHNDVNHKSIYLTEDLDVRLGSFGRATKALRTESRSESNDVFNSNIAYNDFFLSKKRNTDNDAPPSKSDDVFSLGASIYATLVDVGTMSKKFYKICEMDFKMKYPLMKEIVRVGTKFGEESNECKLVFDLMSTVEMCSVEKNVKIKNVCAKFSKLFSKPGFEDRASDAAEELKQHLHVRSPGPGVTWGPLRPGQNVKLYPWCI